ncbi:MAG: hypothetical protein ACOVMQ_00395 [Cyclobacteriaceae bacterium]
MIGTLEAIQQKFNTAPKNGKKVSLADLIVLAGGVAIEKLNQFGMFEVALVYFIQRFDNIQFTGL